MRSVAIVFVLAVVLGVGVRAQDASQAVTTAEAPAALQALETPTLSEVDRLKIANVAQLLEILDLRRQQIEMQRQIVTRELSTLIESLQRPGYTLDLETMRYTPTPKPQEATTTE